MTHNRIHGRKYNT